MPKFLWVGVPCWIRNALHDGLLQESSRMRCRESVKSGKEVNKPNNVIMKECCCYHRNGGLLRMLTFGKEEGFTGSQATVSICSAQS